jgi:hypothetical protein
LPFNELRIPHAIELCIFTRLSNRPAVGLDADQLLCPAGQCKGEKSGAAIKFQQVSRKFANLVEYFIRKRFQQEPVRLKENIGTKTVFDSLNFELARTQRVNFSDTGRGTRLLEEIIQLGSECVA